MSAYGFRAYNDANQVLISSDLENLHYGGKATYGGLASSMAEYGGHQIHTYTFTTTGLPLVFIKPIFYDRFYAVLTHKQVGSLWTFDVIHSGTTDAHPDLHIFVTPKDLSAPTEEYGLQVFLENGDPSFDSRLSPLSIVGGGNCIPPAAAPNDGIPPSGVLENTLGWHDCNLNNYMNELNWDFKSDQVQTYNSYTHSLSQFTDLMFSSPSLAQAAYRIKRHHYHCDNCGSSWEANEYHTANLEVGVFYRNAFRITSTGFDAGWIPLLHRKVLAARRDSWASWLTGGKCSGSMDTGFPFEDKTVNRVNNAYILARASTYV